MDRKIRRIIILAAALMLVFSAGTAVYADTASDAGIAVFSLPGADIVGGGTKPAPEPETKPEPEVQPEPETEPEDYQPVLSTNSGLVLANVPSTADIGEIALFASLLGGSSLAAAAAAVMFRIEKRRLFISEEHDRVMDEFRKTCSDARKEFDD